MADLPDLTLAAFVDAIALDRPAPGAGSAAAVALALGAACAAKAFRISARHSKEAALASAADIAEALAREALIDAQHDVDDFSALIRAPEDPAPVRALEADGKAVLDAVAALRELIAGFRDLVTPTMGGDIAAALALAHAAEQVARRNLKELG